MLYICVFACMWCVGWCYGFRVQLWIPNMSKCPLHLERLASRVLCCGIVYAFDTDLPCEKLKVTVITFFPCLCVGVFECRILPFSYLLGFLMPYFAIYAAMLLCRAAVECCFTRIRLLKNKCVCVYVYIYIYVYIQPLFYWVSTFHMIFTSTECIFYFRIKYYETLLNGLWWFSGTC